VQVEIEADVDGWAKARNINAATALIELRDYLRETDPTQGQTYLTLARPTAVHVDLGLDGLTLD
jgi:hypothetical protein